MNDFKKLVTTKRRCKCGAELPQYPLYTNEYEIIKCIKCGKEYRRKRIKR